MHLTMNIAHRDLKAENILFKSADPSDLTIKMCDFGFAAKITEGQKNKPLTSLVGSPYYIAPEVLSREYDYRCDLWSAGILLYFMLSHAFPFKGPNTDEIFHSIKKEKVSFDGLIWSTISEEAKDLIQKLLVKSPDVRLTAQEALNHPFITNYCSGGSRILRNFSH